MSDLLVVETTDWNLQMVAAHAQTWVGEHVRLLWPMSPESAPLWVALAVVAGTGWSIDFLCRNTPGAIRRDAARKGDKISKMMAAVLAYAERKGATDDTKLPEASRLFELLWDDTAECRTTVYTDARELNAKIEVLFKRVAKQDSARPSTRRFNRARASRRLLLARSTRRFNRARASRRLLLRSSNRRQKC